MITRSESETIERAGVREVPREQWRDVLNELSERFRGWRATIEVRGRGEHRARVGHGLPLQGLSFEREGSEAGDVMIETGDWPDFYFVHHIDRPRMLRFTEPSPRCPAELEIESEEGRTTFVRLRGTGGISGSSTGYDFRRSASSSSIGWAPLAFAAAVGLATGAIVGLTLAEARESSALTAHSRGGMRRRRRQWLHW